MTLRRAHTHRAFDRVGAFATALVAAACVAGAACAAPTRGGPTPVPDPEPVPARREVVRTGTGDLVEFHPESNHAWIVRIAVRVDSLWPRVLGAYEKLGLPVAEGDFAHHSLGTSAIAVLGSIGGTSLGQYLDCGAGPLGRPAADTYRVTLRVTTDLLPDSIGGPGGGTTVRTLVEAIGSANSTRSDPVTCLSTGRLETRLARLVAPATPSNDRR